jgi:hypothetical protein
MLGFHSWTMALFYVVVPASATLRAATSTFWQQIYAQAQVLRITPRLLDLPQIIAASKDK